MKKLLVVFLLVPLCGCKNDMQKRDMESIKYYKDTRTDICYAVIGMGSGRTITAVDCSKLKKSSISPICINTGPSKE